MRLKVLIPSQVLLDEEATKVVAEGENGFFGLLPQHVDFVSVLVPGILSFNTEDEKERFVAVDEGVLVKCGSEVLVSVRSAVEGESLGSLRQTVDEEFRRLDEMERKSRSALVKLETDFVRRFLEWGGHG